MDYQYNCLEETLTHNIDFLLLKSPWNNNFEHNFYLSKLVHSTRIPLKANKTDKNISTQLSWLEHGVVQSVSQEHGEEAWSKTRTESQHQVMKPALKV